MSTDFKPGQLIDLEGVAQYLGQPLGSVRRWIHHPPEGFPQVVRLGTKIVVRFSQLERWATEPTMAGVGNGGTQASFIPQGRV